MKQESSFEQKLLKDIAEYLECGMICFVHKSTHELSYVPDDLEFHEETEVWDELQEKIDKEPDSFYRFEKMDSRQGFSVMEAFANHLEDTKFQDRLLHVLSNRKPFANFKRHVESSAWREDWFDFRLGANIKWVQEQLNQQNY